jgi:hypothetical protein
MEEKTCPKCKQTFVCQHSEKCWCISIKLSEQQRKQLSEIYDNCLCKKCLLEFSEK